MSKEKFPDRNVDGDVARKVGTLEVLTAPKGLKFKVVVEFDAKLEKEAGKDPLLKAEMWEKVNEVYDDLVERIADNLQKTDRGAINLRDSNHLEKLDKLVAVVNRAIIGATRVAEQKAKKAVLAHWAELCEKRKEYLKYKIKIVATIVGAAAGLAASITAMAATPFSGGASAVISIIGMVKSVLTIGKELVNAAKTVIEAIEELEGQVKELETLWKNTKMGHVNEVAQTVIESFVGLPTTKSTIKTCISDLSLAKNKLRGVDVRNHELAKKLQKILVNIDKLRDDFIAEVERKLKNHVSPKAVLDLPKVRKNLDKLLEPYEAQVQTCLVAIQKNNKTIKKAIDQLKPLEKRVTEIAQMRKLKAYVLLDNVLTLKDLGFSALSGNALVSGTQSILSNVIPAGGSFVYDKIVGKAIDGTFLA